MSHSNTDVRARHHQSRLLYSALQEDLDFPVEPGAVGEADPAHSAGFHVGTAPIGARPMSPATLVNTSGRGSPLPGGHGASRPATSGTSRFVDSGARPGGEEDEEGLGTSGSSLSDRNDLFLRYKHATEQGRQLAAAVKDKQQHVKQLKDQLKVG